MVDRSSLLQRAGGVLALGLMLIACGSGESSSAPRLLASEIIINPAPSGEYPVAWNSVTAEDDGRVVVVSFNGGNARCFPASRLVVTPRNDVAVIEFFTAKPEPGRSCTMEAVGREEKVTLSQPLPPGTGFVRAGAESRALVASETKLILEPLEERAVEWTSAVLADDGRSITFTFLGGNAKCYPASRMVVTPQADKAAVALFTSRLDRPVTCTDMAVDRVETIAVGTPLPSGTEIVSNAGQDG